MNARNGSVAVNEGKGRSGSDDRNVQRVGARNRASTYSSAECGPDALSIPGNGILLNS
jgi:hypothetical protein